MNLRSLTLASLLAFGATATMAGELAYPCEDIAHRARLTGFGTAVYQGDDGWFFRSNEIGHVWSMSDRSATFLERLDAVLQQHGVQLVLMPLPSKSMLAPGHAIVAASDSNLIYDPAYSRQQFVAALANLRALDLPVVDVLAETDKTAGEDVAYFFAQDLHWRPELSKAAAIAAATEIAAVFPGEFPAGKTFKTRLKTPEPEFHKTSSRLFLNQLCKSMVPAESLPLYETLEQDQSVDAFLGEEEGAPPVSVIGTSFTDETKVYNFSGFLREALAADVASYSIAGGNIDQSLFKWAHTGQADSGTRVLLWEIPYLDRLEAAAIAMQRTVVPAIAGSCIGKDTEIAATDYTLDGNAPFTLTLPDDVEVTGDNYYLVAELSDPTPRGFAVTSDYRDGKRDIFPVVRETRVGAIDHVYAELAPDFGDALGSISIRAMQGGQNSGRLALCRYPEGMPGAVNGGTGAAELSPPEHEVTQ